MHHSTDLAGAGRLWNISAAAGDGASGSRWSAGAAAHARISDAGHGHGTRHVWSPAARGNASAVPQKHLFSSKPEWQPLLRTAAGVANVRAMPGRRAFNSLEGWLTGFIELYVKHEAVDPDSEHIVKDKSMGMAREICVAEVRATLESLQQAHHPTPLNSRYTEWRLNL